MTLTDGDRIRDEVVDAIFINSFVLASTYTTAARCKSSADVVIVPTGSDSLVTVNVLFQSNALASQAKNFWSGSAAQTQFAQSSGFLEEADVPVVYPFTATTSSSLFQFSAQGLVVDTVNFVPDCKETGCWQIDVTVTLGQDSSFNALYVPKDSNSPNAADFPCRDDGNPVGRSMSVCCLKDVVDNYRTVGNFETSVATIDCSGASFPNPSVVNGFSDNVIGGVSGLTTSDVSSLGGASSLTRSERFRIQFDEAELRSSAGVLTGTVGVEYTVDTFVGILNFIPTVTVLDSAASQTRIRLEKSDVFTASSYGANQLTFIEYSNLRIVEVYNANDRDETDQQIAQYVAVTIGLSGDYAPPDTGGVIPLSSVRVGWGNRFSRAEWDHACQLPSWSLQNRQFFTRRLNQYCGPKDAQMCAQITAIEDKLLTFNVPLGADYFIESEKKTDMSKNIFVHLVVNVYDSAGKKFETTLSSQIPLTTAGTAKWCHQEGGLVDLRAVSDADLLVGTAGTMSEFENVRLFVNISNAIREPLPSTLINIDSLESALFTLVAKGDASYFLLPRAKDFALELEDVITMHLLEQGSDTLNRIVYLVDNGLAFNATNTWKNLRSHLVPNPDLLEHCNWALTPPTMGELFPTACVMRRDQKERLPVIHNVRRMHENDVEMGGRQTALELNMHNNQFHEYAGHFMQTMLGETDYAFELGVNYSTILTEVYKLNGRYNRAWWINPAYEWSPTFSNAYGGQYMLSKQLIFFALVNLNELWSEEQPPLVDCWDENVGDVGKEDDPYKCIQVNRVRKTWIEAHRHCANEGGELVFIENDQENVRTGTLAAEVADTVWIGYNDRIEEGFWTWQGELHQEYWILMGSKNGYLNWGTHEGWNEDSEGENIWSNDGSCAIIYQDVVCPSYARYAKQHLGSKVVADLWQDMPGGGCCFWPFPEHCVTDERYADTFAWMPWFYQDNLEAALIDKCKKLYPPVEVIYNQDPSHFCSNSTDIYLDLDSDPVIFRKLPPDETPLKLPQPELYLGESFRWSPDLCENGDETAAYICAHYVEILPNGTADCGGVPAYTRMIEVQTVDGGGENITAMKCFHFDYLEDGLPTTRVNAENACQAQYPASEGYGTGHLASIMSRQQQELVLGYLAEGDPGTFTGYSGKIWISYNQLEETGVWSWTGQYLEWKADLDGWDNEEITAGFTRYYSAWDVSKTPDEDAEEYGYGGEFDPTDSSNRDCAMMAKPNIFSWESSNCDRKRPFVCEFDFDIRTEDDFPDERRNTHGRMLLQAVSDLTDEQIRENRNGMAAQSIEFGVSPASVMAKIWGIDPAYATDWSSVLAISDQEACMEGPALKQLLKQKLDTDLAKAASGKIADTQITNVAVDTAGLECTSRRRSGLGRSLLAAHSSGAHAVVDFIVLFEEGESDLTIDLAKLPQADYLSFTAFDDKPTFADVSELDLGVDASEVTDDDEKTASDSDDKEAAEDDDDSGGGNTAVIAGGAAGGAAALLAVVGVGYYMTTRKGGAGGNVPVAVAGGGDADFEALKSQLRDDSVNVAGRAFGLERQSSQRSSPGSVEERLFGSAA